MLLFKSNLSRLFIISIALLTACSSNSTEQIDNPDTSVIVQQGLLSFDWTLETVRDADGVYYPLPLNPTYSLRFEIDGSISGTALCNEGGGDWQADDATFSISNWVETEIACESSSSISAAAGDIIQRLFVNEMVMPRIDSKRLFLDMGDNAQLILSGRERRDVEQAVRFEVLLHSEGSARASNGNPVFGDLDSPFVIYRDADSLLADFALLPEEETPWPALPDIDFSNNIVIAGYLPLDGAISSDVAVRNARNTGIELEIEVAYFGPEVPDEASASSCDFDTALTAPYTFVRIESVNEPVILSKVARSNCSGIPLPSEQVGGVEESNDIADNDGTLVSESVNEPIVDPLEESEPVSEPASGGEPPALDLSKVQWLHTDVSGWSETSNLSSVTFNGDGGICLNHDKANSWPSRNLLDADLIGNAWVFIWNENNDVWYGATWEWFRPGQTCKRASSVDGIHIKRGPYSATSGWEPSSGETLYFMVSGLARNSERNVQERSAPVKVIWP